MKLVCWMPLLLLPFPAMAEEEPVPPWFARKTGDPYALFSAWRELSTPEAAADLGGPAGAIGGLVKDEQGRPLPNTTITFHYDGIGKGSRTGLVTDAKGYFIVYGPPQPKMRPRKPPGEAQASPEEQRAIHDRPGCDLLAAPGYPPSELAREYANARGEWRICIPQPLMEEADRAFYVFQVKSENTFAPEGFSEFVAQRVAKSAAETRSPWRDRTKSWEASDHRSATASYEARLVDPRRKRLPGAIVKYSVSARNYSCRQIVKTDAQGECELKERVPPAVTEFQRHLTVDAQEFGIGPVAWAPQPDVLNVIQLEPPADIRGQIVDHRGDPVHMSLFIEYRQRADCPFELMVRSLPDGTFAFSRIIPGQEFRVVAGRMWPRASVEGEWMTLAAGEVREGIRLQVPLPTSLRGVVVDQQGRPIPKARTEPSFPEGSGSLQGRCWEDSTFFYGAFGAKPFQIRAWADGYGRVSTEEIRLEPGELRFLPMTLKPSAASAGK